MPGQPTGIGRRKAIGFLLAVAGWTVAGGASAGKAVAKTRKFGVLEIADGVFVHRGKHDLQRADNYGDISNCGFVVGQSGVGVIDTSGSFRAGGQLREAIRRHTDKPIRYVINTHMHPDHVLGNAAFKQDGVQFVGHSKLARALAARGERYLSAARQAMGEKAFAGTEIVLPTVTAESPVILDLGNRQLALLPQTTAHTDNDLMIRDETTKTLFVGDLIFSGHTPALDGSILGWVEVLKNLGKVEANRIVPGHGPEMMKLGDASKPMLRYLNAVIADVRKIIAQDGTINEAMARAAQQERERWELFDDFHRRNVSAAFAELEWE
ncbi:MAG: quinoprotein relay system zinc metallohydrolase 2 [Alphaproteobacteria bacterium]|nr:quinoprotein relay system zinc metallohydrolase 2 [Alphaproteobacteria bacterium]